MKAIKYTRTKHAKIRPVASIPGGEQL